MDIDYGAWWYVTMGFGLFGLSFIIIIIIIIIIILLKVSSRSILILEKVRF